MQIWYSWTMKSFRYIDDIEDWLEPMDYHGFWYAVHPFDLVLQPRDHCDQQIASGEVDKKLVLDVLKAMTRMELTKRHGLHWRMPTPWLKLVESR